MYRAPIRQCALLVGGLGTRLGPLTADTPKPLLPCGDRLFLAWLLRELQRFGIEDFLLLTGHLSERVRESLDAIAATLPRKATIRISEEPLRAGTGGALLHARDLLESRFLLCNGDSLFSFNLATMLAAAATDSADAIGRLALCQLSDTARYGLVETADDMVAGFREKTGAAKPGTINAGVYVLDRAVLDHVTEVCSLERDVLPALAAQGRLRGTAAHGYFVDIGITADLERARRELPGRLHRPALFLDRDGVLNLDHGHVGTRERWDWVPGAITAVRRAVEWGWHVFVVTNQSGIARGFYTEADVHALMGWVGEQLRAHGGTLDDWRFCPFHPEAPLQEYRRVDDWRKPGPGMVLDLIRAWELDPRQALMVGDSVADMQAAAAAGVRGVRFPGGDLDRFLGPLLVEGKRGDEIRLS